MSRTRHSRSLALAVVVGACLLTAPGVAWGQFQFGVNYFSNNLKYPTLDQTVRIVNPGTYAPTYPPASMCAMIYVFDNLQNMRECCGCLITADGIAELSVHNSLTNNPFEGTQPNDGNIKIISAVSNSTSPPCDPTGGGIGPTGSYVLNIAPTSGLNAWSTHLPGYLPAGADGAVTETKFLAGDVNKTEVNSLQEQCTGIFASGGGAGQCEVAGTNGICNHF